MSDQEMVAKSVMLSRLKAKDATIEQLRQDAQGLKAQIGELKTANQGLQGQIDAFEPTRKELEQRKTMDLLTEAGVKGDLAQRAIDEYERDKRIYGDEAKSWDDWLKSAKEDPIYSNFFKADAPAEQGQLPAEPTKPAPPATPSATPSANAAEAAPPSGFKSAREYMQSIITDPAYQGASADQRSILLGHARDAGKRGEFQTVSQLAAAHRLQLTPPPNAGS